MSPEQTLRTVTELLLPHDHNSRLRILGAAYAYFAAGPTPLPPTAPRHTDTIHSLALSVRTANALELAGLVSLEQIETMRDEDLLRIKTLGKKCLREIRTAIAEHRGTKDRTPEEVQP